MMHLKTLLAALLLLTMIASVDSAAAPATEESGFAEPAPAASHGSLTRNNIALERHIQEDTCLGQVEGDPCRLECDDSGNVNQLICTDYCGPGKDWVVLVEETISFGITLYFYSCLYPCGSNAGKYFDCSDSALVNPGGQSYVCDQLCPDGGTAPTAPTPICFSGATTVELESGQSVPLHSLKVGDRIKVDHAGRSETYEPVYGFAKRNHSVVTEYLKLTWQDQSHGALSFLEISPKHMLRVSRRNEGVWTMLPASKVKIGDKLMVDIGNSGKHGIISSISTIKAQGAFAPLVFSGQIVANGVQVSSYVSIQNEEFLVLGSEMRVAVNYHWLAHMFLLPMRWFGVLVAAPLETDLLSWLPDFFAILEQGLLSVLRLPAMVLLPFVIPVISVMGACALAEAVVLTILDHKAVFLLVILIAVLVRRSLRIEINKKMA